MASAKEYDGIWFLGFNIQKPPFDRLKVRQAVAHCLNTNFIATEIISEESAPVSFIPPGMTGYLSDLKPYKLNVPYAKTLIKRAGYAPNSSPLKNLTLLHTDGIKTVEIARRIQNDLKQLGMKINLVKVSYFDEDKWDRELASNKYNLILMGYKAEIARLYTEEAYVKETDPVRLVDPLFRTNGDANFTGFSNPTLDMLLDRVSAVNPSLVTERESKLKEINKILYQELPAVVLFYIEKL